MAPKKPFDPTKDSLYFAADKLREMKKNQFDKDNAANKADISNPQFGRSWNDKMREMYPHLYSSK